MAYTSRDRDRARRAVTVATVAGSVGALTATGWLMGAAASDFAAQQQPQQSRPADQAERRVRPYVTRVTVRYVIAAASTTSAPGPGPTVVPAGTSSGPGPAPEPAPAPAPSSGS